MFARTVSGDIRIEDLGLTLSHEHLFIRLCDGWFVEPTTEEEARWADEKLTLENLSHVRRRAWTNRDNCIVEDPDLVAREASAFAAAGGRTLVDVTPTNLGRNVRALREVSEAVGINVIAGCGYYIDSSHSEALRAMSVEAVAEEFERELVDGIDGTGVRAGVIGEIGTGNPVMPGEQKVLRAAARAQRSTGAPICVHLSPARGLGNEVLDIVEEEGADLQKVALGHLDCQDPIVAEDHITLARRGAFVVYDQFGANWGNDELRELHARDFYWSPPPSDQQRAAALKELLRAGVWEKVLISSDVCSKIQQAAWGGPGFVHIPRYVRPFLEANGFSANELSALLERNPQNWLAWEPPERETSMRRR